MNDSPNTCPPCCRELRARPRPGRRPGPRWRRPGRSPGRRTGRQPGPRGRRWARGVRVREALGVDANREQAHPPTREQRQWVQIGRVAPQPPVQARRLRATGMTRGQPADDPASGDRLARRYPRLHRFVTGPQPAGVGDADHAAPGDPPGEPHHAGRCRAHRRLRAAGQVDPPVAGKPRPRGRLEHPGDTDRRGQRPPMDRWRRSGQRPGHGDPTGGSGGPDGGPRAGQQDWNEQAQQGGTDPGHVGSVGPGVGRPQRGHAPPVDSGTRWG